MDVLDANNKSIIKDRIVPKSTTYEYSFEDLGWGYYDKSQTAKFSYKCRDVIDTIWKRSQKNPTQYVISRNSREFGEYITMLPKTPETVFNYKNYKIGDVTYSGVEVMNESAVDIYRIYANTNRTLFTSVETPCYFTQNGTNLYTYFTTKVYTDSDNANYKFGRYVWSTTQTQQALEALPCVTCYITKTLKPTCETKYDKLVDSGSIILSIPNQTSGVPDVSNGKFVQERVMCALLSFEKQDLSTGKYEEVIPKFDIRTNSSPVGEDSLDIRVDDLDLGTYRYKLNYSSVNTRNCTNCGDCRYYDKDKDKHKCDSNNEYVSGDIVVKAPYADTITAQVAKVPFNDTLTSITFSWTLHHKKATNFRLYWKETDSSGNLVKEATVNLKNTTTYHNPSHYFTNGNKVQFYFKYNSDDVEWGTNTNHIVPFDYATSTKHTFTV